jgi:hypothetical protein
MERISISMIIRVLPSSTIGLDRGCYWTTLDIVSIFTLKTIQGVVLFDFFRSIHPPEKSTVYNIVVSSSSRSKVMVFVFPVLMIDAMFR